MFIIILTYDSNIIYYNLHPNLYNLQDSLICPLSYHQHHNSKTVNNQQKKPNKVKYRKSSQVYNV